MGHGLNLRHSLPPYIFVSVNKALLTHKHSHSYTHTLTVSSCNRPRGPPKPICPLQKKYCDLDDESEDSLCARTEITRSGGSGEGSSPVSHHEEMETCSAGLGLGFRMTSLVGSGGRGFWEDLDGITWAGEARLENHSGDVRKAAGGYPIGGFDQSSDHVPDRRVWDKGLTLAPSSGASAYQGGGLRLS